MDKLDRNIYCIIGDGESREGQIWEAADFIVDHAADQCRCRSSTAMSWRRATGSARSRVSRAWPKSSQAYGFIVRVIDGHDPLEIGKALSELHVIQNGNRPLAIVARTVKGWGASGEQGMGKHGTPVKKDKLADVLGELDTDRQGSGRCRLQGRRRTENLPPTPKCRRIHADTSAKPIKIASFAEGLAAVGHGQGSGRGQADRAAQGIWRGAGGAGRGGQAQSSGSTRM